MPHDQGIRTVLVAAPATEPLTLAELKSHLRVDLVDDDTLITGIGIVAREVVEDLTGLRLITQTWKLILDRFPLRRWIEIPLGPSSAISSVKYRDTDGTQFTQTAGEYIADTDSIKARVVLKDDFDWPDPDLDLQVVNAVEIEFIVGYGAAAAVPERLKTAIKLIVGHYYENREAVALRPGTTFQELPMGVQALLAPMRLYARSM